MEFSHEDENENFSLTRFESMLKTNNVLFFDSTEFENIIHHYLNTGKIALAKKAIKLGLQQHPASINLRLFKVEISVFEDKLDEADALLDELYNIDPFNEEIFIQKANIFSKKDQHQKAIEVLLQALDLAEELSDLYSLIGMEYLFLDQFENAKTYFMKCLEEDNQDYSALYNVIYCFDFLDQNSEAIEYLNMYLDTNPYCEVAWHQLGKQYFAIKEYEKALSSFEFAIISDDQFIGAYLEKGKVLEKLGRFTEAIEHYTITMTLEEPSSFALLRIGHCHEKLGSDDLAVQYYYKTVHEDPLLDKGWISITNFYNKKQNYLKALYYINKAINIDSENVMYWKLYAQINQRLKFYEEASHGYKKALEYGNYELETWIARADVLLKIGEYQGCINNLLQAAEFYPENAEIEYRLSGLYYTTNKSNEGEYHLKNALNLDNEYKIILEELFPKIMNRPSVKQIFADYKKASN